MWSNVISIDKGLTKETEFILDKIKGIKNLSFAVEESKDRSWIYLASLCELQDAVETEIQSVLATVFLSFIKLRFFLSNLSNLELNHANCALISSLVHFDRNFEEAIVRKVLSETIDYNVDGLLNFRMRALTDNWAELAELASKLLSTGGGGEIFDIASFITGTEGARSRLSISQDSLINLTDHQRVEIIDLFDTPELNLISAIIKERPCEILLKDVSFSAPMTATLRHIAKIIAN